MARHIAKVEQFTHGTGGGGERQAKMRQLEELLDDKMNICVLKPTGEPQQYCNQAAFSSLIENAKWPLRKKLY